MRGFEVFLNKKKVCLASIGDNGVLSAIVNCLTRDKVADQFLEVGGLASPTHTHIAWTKQKRLRLGDEIRIRIVETVSPDEPISEHRRDASQELNYRKCYVRRMAKRLGLAVQVRSKAK
jgi:hypothetical protein